MHAFAVFTKSQGEEVIDLPSILIAEYCSSACFS